MQVDLEDVASRTGFESEICIIIGAESFLTRLGMTEFEWCLNPRDDVKT